MWYVWLPKGVWNMSKIAFVGFGEVNTPIDIIIRK